MRRLADCPFAVYLPAGLRERVEGLARGGQRHFGLNLVKLYARSPDVPAKMPYVDDVRDADFSFCAHCDSDDHTCVMLP